MTNSIYQSSLRFGIDSQSLTEGLASGGKASMFGGNGEHVVKFINDDSLVEVCAGTCFTPRPMEKKPIGDNILILLIDERYGYKDVKILDGIQVPIKCFRSKELFDSMDWKGKNGGIFKVGTTSWNTECKVSSVTSLTYTIGKSIMNTWLGLPKEEVKVKTENIPVTMTLASSLSSSTSSSSASRTLEEIIPTTTSVRMSHTTIGPIAITGDVVVEDDNDVGDHYHLQHDSENIESRSSSKKSKSTMKRRVHKRTARTARINSFSR
jgi:hypothetical protein